VTAEQDLAVFAWPGRGDDLSLYNIIMQKKKGLYTVCKILHILLDSYYIKDY